MRGWKMRSTLAILGTLYTLGMINVQPTSASDRGFYAIAHQSNTLHAVDWAMHHGANALEVDLQFEPSGTPKEFYHGKPCDCSCYQFCFWCKKPYICTHSPVCKHHTDIKLLLEHIASFPSLALVWIDSKLKLSASYSVQATAARSVIDITSRYLFENGYTGKVLIGSPGDNTYLEILMREAESSPYISQYYFAIDEVSNKPLEIISQLVRLPSRNVIYSNGLSACSPKQFYNEFKVAAINQFNDVVSAVFVWTVDRTKSFKNYYRYGARGMITNKIPNLIDWLRKNNIRLATPGDDSLMPATSRQVIDPKCSCVRRSGGGCLVTKPSPPHSACYCSKKIFWRCSGEVVLCKQPKSSACVYPSTGVQNCLQGGGNCDGYKRQKCHCKKVSGGCRITSPAPANTACHCKQSGWWTKKCTGYLVRCPNIRSPYCKRPDTSRHSCLLGGGNCGAYGR